MKADDENARGREFAAGASQARRGIVGEFATFLRYHRKWWLLPLIVILLLFGALMVVGNTAAGPWLYTLF